MFPCTILVPLNFCDVVFDHMVIMVSFEIKSLVKETKLFILIPTNLCVLYNDTID